MKTVKSMTIKGNAHQLLFALMFLGDMLGEKTLAETSPEEVRSVLGLVYKDKKIDLA